MKPRKSLSTLNLSVDLMNNFRCVAMALGKEPTDLVKNFIENWIAQEGPKAVQKIKQQIQAKAG